MAIVKYKFEGFDCEADLDANNPKCPQCNNGMWDNRTNKRNPKSPDYKCKDKDCGCAIWLPKENEQPVQKPCSNKPAPVQKQVSPEGVSLKEKTMILSYAKDISVALIKESIIQNREDLGDLVNIIDEVYKGLIKTLEG